MVDGACGVGVRLEKDGTVHDPPEAVIDRGCARVHAAGQLDRHGGPGTVLIDN